VNFDFDEHVLDSGAISQIEQNAACLKTMPGTVQLDGYADERGDDEYNLALGKRRSASVKRTLKRMIRGRSIKTMSYGEEGSLCSDQSESCWSRNRRVQTSVR
jgi:peptidoglycan-associated lipoprotein